MVEAICPHLVLLPVHKVPGTVTRMRKQMGMANKLRSLLRLLYPIGHDYLGLCNAQVNPDSGFEGASL